MIPSAIRSSSPLWATVALAGLLLAPSAGYACDQGEKVRLAGEMKKLAARNAWTGVERSYVALLETKCDLEFKNYFLGAESARYLGKTYEQYERLKKASALEEQEEITQLMADIERRWGKVEVKGDPRRRPTLERPSMPFAPDERKSIEWAVTVVSETGSFKGMLPLGDYVVGGIEFTVAAGSDEFQVIEVGKVKGGPVEKQEGFRYQNLVALVGPGFLASPSGSFERTMDTPDFGEKYQFHPASMGASGLSLQVGYEIGLTYAEPAFGVAGVLGYQGGFGTDTMHVVSGWAAGVMRPGNLRVALGPTFSYQRAQGTGVREEVFNPGGGGADGLEWSSRTPSDGVLFGGYSFGPGARGSVGYGVLDFDKLQGIVELGGSFTRDSARSWFGVGLSVGIVPTVPRFKG